MITTKISEFCRRHNIDILDDNKRIARRSVPRPVFFTDPLNYNYVAYDPTGSDTEPLLTMTIPESELAHLQYVESQLVNHVDSRERFILFNSLTKQKEQEQRLRDKYPAVQKAFETYSLALALAKSGDS